MFDKRDNFLFFIVRMPYLSSNVPSLVFYSSVFSVLLRIAQYTLILTDFVPKASQLSSRMVTEGVNKASILRHNNQRNIYVPTSKLQLVWQKLYICIYVCVLVYICMCIYVYV